MNKLIFVAAIMISSILFGIYYTTSYASSSTADIPDIKGPSPNYLTDHLDNKTKIFLVSSDNPRYGFCNWSYRTLSGIEVHDGDPCFIVNVTVRNDYTTDPIWKQEDAPSSLYNNHVKLTAYLYNQYGKVDAVDVTYPINSLHGGHVFKIEPEKIHSVELYIATDHKDVERYEIYVTYIGPAIEP